ncbi:MAG: hypothetical protein ACRDSH_14165 [Pseudonocardiaceae bacterium]
MDPENIDHLITAGAGLGGAIIGGLTTLWAGQQAKKSEHEKEARAREQAAAERCGAHIKKMTKLTVHEQIYRDGDDDAYVHRQNELQRLDGELGADALYLADKVQGRIELARGTLRNANELINYGLFYRGVSAIADSVASHLNEVLTAVVTGAPVPERSEAMRHLAVALDNLDDQKNQEYAEEVHEYQDEKRQWLAQNQEANSPAPVADGRLHRYRRRLAIAIAPK